MEILLIIIAVLIILVALGWKDRYKGIEHLKPKESKSEEDLITEALDENLKNIAEVDKDKDIMIQEALKILERDKKKNK